MSTDWQAGDIALCIDARPNAFLPLHASGLEKDRYYTVAGVDLVWDFSLGRMVTGLSLNELRPTIPSGCFLASRFRKVRPDTLPGYDEALASLIAGHRVPVSA